MLRRGVGCAISHSLARLSRSLHCQYAPRRPIALPFLTRSLPHNGSLVMWEDKDGGFKDRLESTVREQQKEGKNSVWLELPLNQAHLAAQAGECGFDIFTAQGACASLRCSKHLD
eukprot:g15874.t1